MDTNNITAMEHPLIKEFISLVETKVGDGVLDFKDLQDRQFMKFWPNIIIFKLEKKLDDFSIIFFGTNVVEGFGEDHTGKFLSKANFHGTEEIIHNQNVKVLEENSRIYVSTPLFWRSEFYKSVSLMRLPLQRNGSINESITLVYFA